MNDQILSVLKTISDFNQMVKRSKERWAICPDFCYYYNSVTRESIFVKEVMDFVRQRGTEDKTQTAEELAAFGQLYVIDSAVLLSHFGCELVKK